MGWICSLSVSTTATRRLAAPKLSYIATTSASPRKLLAASGRVWILPSVQSPRRPAFCRSWQLPGCYSATSLDFP